MINKRRKNYNKWVHLILVSSGQRIKERLDPLTMCGRTAKNIEKTTDITKVTCERCIQELDK